MNGPAVGVFAVVMTLGACGGAPGAASSPDTNPDSGVMDACLGVPGTPAVAVLGTGMFSPEPLTPGQTIVYEAGPQGGHHVWVSVRARGVLQSGTRTTFGALDLSNPAAPVELATRTVPFVLSPDEGGTCLLVGLRLQLDERGTVDVRDLVGHPLRLFVELLDPDGRRARDAVDVVLAAPALPDAGITTP